MKIRINYRWYFFYLFIAIPLLFLPLGFDYSIFVLGGKVIAEGGKLYVDFIDIKPPFVYYLFALLFSLFGFKLIYYKIFNLLIIFISALVFQKLVFATTKKQTLSFLSPLPMLLYLISLNYNFIFQLETFFILVYLLICQSLLKNNISIDKSILIGVLLGISFSLKYTFGLLILPVAYFYYRKHVTKKANYLALFLSFIFTSVLQFVLVLVQNGSLTNFIFVVQFLKYYQAVLGFDYFSFKEIFNNLTLTFGTLLSIFFISVSFYAVIKCFENYETLEIPERELHYFFAISSLFLIVSIVIEHQFSPYNFTRIVSIVSFYSALGFVVLYNNFRKHSRTKRFILFSMLTLLFLFFSPFPRYIRNFIPVYFYFTNNERYFDFFENPETFHTIYKQQNSIANYLRPRINNSDTITIVGQSPFLYLLLGKGRFSAFPVSIFFLSDFKPPIEWENRLINELNSSKFIILQNYDYSYLFTRKFTTPTSYLRFMENQKYKTILENKFIKVFKTYSLIVYQRKG